ncbi:hypothetical protein FO478_14240 [Heyndrickxia coagulans DSM 1 = ATCC 7050]|nr:hypothetical protein [Heyndrickxia coagulans DSM 1 = ATCC 7050]
MYCRPIIATPRYIIHNCFVPRFQPIIHPLVEVNRTNVVTVPRHMLKPIRKNEVVYHNRPFPCRHFW